MPLHWLRQAARTALLLPARWAGLNGGALVAALWTALSVLVSVAVARAAIAGPAVFYEPALLQGWLPVAVLAWLCWWLVAEPSHALQTPTRATTVYTLLVVQGLILVALSALWWIPIERHGGWHAVLPDPQMQWWVGMVILAWWVGSAGLVLWRASARPAWQRIAGIGVLALSTTLTQQWEAQRVWYPASDSADIPAPPRLTQAQIEEQARLLPAQIDGLAVQQPGVVDVYALTFAPFADEDVFLRESRMVSQVVQQRLRAAGKSLQLVNHKSTVGELPWATPTNLKRALDGIAQRMDKDEDIVFIHLTSHGAKDGQLAAAFEPLAVEPLTPALLKTALDEAGIRHRILSVSACYAGSWIAPLKNEHTLVMTAADTENTSYGCGTKSELTFFGRALFDEALRRDTLDFEAAHAQARKVIEQREKEAGKKDGYSNPQISMGAALRDKLRSLQ